MTTTAATTELVTFEIETRDMKAFEVEFAKLARKAAKLGVAAPTYSVVQADKVYPAHRVFDTGLNLTRHDVNSQVAGRLVPARVVNVICVSGQAPKLAGWTFLACLQHEEAGNIVRTVPGATVQARLDLRTAPPSCEHCKVNRRRNDTYVVAHEDGRQVQVGRQCLRDFTGHDSPEAIARWAELLHAFVESMGDRDEDGGFGGGYAPEVSTLDAFLPFVVASIQQDGWLSRTAARAAFSQQATADLAWTSCFPPKSMKEKDILRPTAEDTARSARALEVARAYFEEHAADSLSDYEHNLRIVVEGLSVTSRTAGIAASLLNFAERLIGKEIERRRFESRKATSQHVGTVGKREVFTLTCEKVIDIAGNYGTTHLHMFGDAAGNVVKWFSSSQRLEVGGTYELKGTVKSQDEYKGTKQTVLTRCKVESKKAAPAA